jgi:CRISPR-associated protein (TIGR03984 family)
MVRALRSSIAIARPNDLPIYPAPTRFARLARRRSCAQGKTGTATLLADGSVEGQPDSTDTGTTIDVLPRTYRVWGEPPKARDGVPPRPIAGWTKLTAGRIGALFVPETPGGPGEVVLRAREYVVRHDTGNAVVLFERLVERLVEFDQAQK